MIYFFVDNPISYLIGAKIILDYFFFMGKSQKVQSSLKNTLTHFSIGGVSGAFATLLIQPIDTLKVQIQVISEQFGRKLTWRNLSLFSVLGSIKEKQGFSVLYRGLDSAILRQLAYASARLGSYTWALERLKEKDVTIGAKQKIMLSMASGIFGALVGNPFDVALIRRQATVTTGKKTYSNTFEAFGSIFREEGIFGLWTGIKITMLRVLLINVGQLAGNQIISDVMKPVLPSWLLHNLSAILASLLTAFLSLPADNIKVKLQKQTPDNIMYTGIWNTLTTTIKREGVLRLWVGFPVYLIRGMPHSFILIRTQQFLRELLLENNPQ